MEACKQRIDWHELPKTFKDAVTTTRSLGLQYIWIDLLYIIQDDRADWETESACIGSIYENSIVTIAATSSSADGEGFLGERFGHFCKSLIFCDDCGNINLGIKVQPYINHYPDDHVASPSLGPEGPLSKQAWALQERLLAPRVLSYGLQELLWECGTTWCCECSSSEPRLRETHPYSTKRLYSHWHKLVEHYSTRQLTKESDRLPAISSVAAKIQAKTKDEYLTGLWKGDLLRDLL